MDPHTSEWPAQEQVGSRERISRSRRQDVSSATANPNRAVTIDGKKFLWDGQLFETHDDASRQAETYKTDNFEVHLAEDLGKFLVYTRRVVKEVVVSAP